MGKKLIRTLFISDVHMGSGFSRADLLLETLEAYEYKSLYIVGDFIDGWKFNRNFHWTQSCNDVLKKILELAETIPVYYCIGNHDEFLRSFAPATLNEIKIAERFIHTTAGGRKMIVRHGDFLDYAVKHMAWLAHFGDKMLSFILTLNRASYWLQQKIKIRYWSLSNYLRRKVNKVLSTLKNFKKMIMFETVEEELEGVICGHIHAPEIVEEDDFLYCNCGDWVENGSAIVEHLDGKFELIHNENFPKLITPVVEYDWPG